MSTEVYGKLSIDSFIFNQPLGENNLPIKQCYDMVLKLDE